MEFRCAGGKLFGGVGGAIEEANIAMQNSPLSQTTCLEQIVLVAAK